MRCPEARSFLHPFLDGELEVDTNVNVLRHLDLCASCRERFEDERRLLARVKTGLAEPCPEPLKMRIFDALAAEERAASRGAGRIITWPRLAAAAAVFVVAFAWVDPICLRGCPTVRALTREHHSAAGEQLSESEAVERAREVLGRDRVVCERMGDGSWCCREARSCDGGGCVVRFSCKKRGTISFVKLPGSDVHPWLSYRAGEGLIVTRQDGCRFAGWRENDCLYGLVADESLPPEQLVALASRLRVEK